MVLRASAYRGERAPEARTLSEPGQQNAARRIAANVAKLPEWVRTVS
jgi:hypothetical protein